MFRKRAPSMTFPLLTALSVPYSPDRAPAPACSSLTRVRAGSGWGRGSLGGVGWHPEFRGCSAGTALERPE
jgi:hypothetical protein